MNRIALEPDRGSAIDAQGTDTHCPYCAMQCGMTLIDGPDGRFSVAARDFPTNRGGLCRKGWTAAALLDAPDRLTTPLIRDRKGGALRTATWDEALGRIVTELRSIRQNSGPDAVAVFGGGGLTNEKAYLLGKFARVALGTANVDYNGRFCMASAAAAGLKAFGLDRGLPFPMQDIAGAEAVMLVGSNPAETLPPIMQYFDEQQRNGGRLIVVDPRRTLTARRASLHLQTTPGTDGALATGLLHVAIRDKLVDVSFIAERTNGFEAVRRIALSYWPDRTERITGVSAKAIEAAAHILGEAASAIVLTGRGPEQQSQGVDNVLAFINLVLALGQAGKPLSGYGCLTGQGNGQGGREHGQKADQLPGYRKLAEPKDRAAVAAVWGIDPYTLPQPGLSACEMFDAIGEDGGIKALMVFGSNVVVSAPEAGRLTARLDSIDLLVVADLFLSETAARADIVLPVAQWAEEEGTMTNLEGRVLRRHRAKAPPPGVWTDAEILSALAERLGARSRFESDAGPIFDELRRASAGGAADYAGMSYARIDEENGLFWPCPSANHPGTPRIFLDRFAHPDGRARFIPVDYRASGEATDEDFPFLLTTGRVLAHYQSGTQTRRIAELNVIDPEPFAELHPQVAKGLGISAGDPIRLTTRRGSIVVTARLSDTIRLDSIFVPFHWGGEASANILTNPALDPVSRIPEFKVCAVRIEASLRTILPARPER